MVNAILKITYVASWYFCQIHGYSLLFNNTDIYKIGHTSFAKTGVRNNARWNRYSYFHPSNSRKIVLQFHSLLIVWMALHLFSRFQNETRLLQKNNSLWRKQFFQRPLSYTTQQNQEQNLFRFLFLNPTVLECIKTRKVTHIIKIPTQLLMEGRKRKYLITDKIHLINLLFGFSRTGKTSCT